jgi:hypothetical protein
VRVSELIKRLRSFLGVEGAMKPVFGDIAGEQVSARLEAMVAAWFNQFARHDASLGTITDGVGRSGALASI